MKSLRESYVKVKAIYIQYPFVLYGAILVSSILYTYLITYLVQYFIKVGEMNFGIVYGIESLEVLPFLILFIVSITRIIELKTNLNKSEKCKLHAERITQLQQAKLTAFHEISRNVQHDINNPLTIINLSLVHARRAAAGIIDILNHIDIIDQAASQIGIALEELSKIHISATNANVIIDYSNPDSPSSLEYS